jgi:hypothetical protein
VRACDVVEVDSGAGTRSSAQAQYMAECGRVGTRDTVSGGRRELIVADHDAECNIVNIEVRVPSNDEFFSDFQCSDLTGRVGLKPIVI